MNNINFWKQGSMICLWSSTLLYLLKNYCITDLYTWENTSKAQTASLHDVNIITIHVFMAQITIQSHSIWYLLLNEVISRMICHNIKLTNSLMDIFLDDYYAYFGCHRQTFWYIFNNWVKGRSQTMLIAFWTYYLTKF